ncbi:MAG: DUF4249 family protein [Bacteroidota bacterium]
MRISIYSFLIFFVFIACDTNVDFEGAEYPIEPVVYAHLNADSTVEARVMHSAPVRGEFSSDRAIDDARVVLIENGEDSTLLELTSEGQYKANFIPNMESQYSLWVESSYGNMLSSSVKIPGKPKVGSSYLEPYQKGYFNYTDLLRSAWEIEGALPQFLSLQAGYEQANQFQPIRITPVEDAFISVCGGGSASNLANLYDVVDFEDECLESDSLKIAVAFNREDLPEASSNLILKFATTTQEYHDFEANLIDYRAMDLFFEEPLPPYSNFDFGYGYFAAFNEVEVVLSL